MNKNTTLALTILAALAPIGGVQAGAIGTAYLGVENLLFTKADGSNIVLGTDILGIGGGTRNNGDTLAALNGVSDTATGDQEIAIPTFDVGVSDLGNNGFSCVGDCASYANNSFTYLTKPSDVPGGSYALNDVRLTGAIIDIGNPSALGSDAYALAESALLPTGVGTAQGNVGLVASFKIISNFTGDIKFSLDYEAYLRAALINVVGTSANARIGWVLSIDSLNDGDLYSFNLANDDEWVRSNIGTTVAGQDREASFSGTAGGQTKNNFFKAGQEYELTITHDVLADSQAIPTPAPLALISFGLLALGATMRRRIAPSR